MSQKIELRPVSGTDEQRWRELMMAYAEFYKTSVSDEGLAATWKWIEDTEENFWCTFALDGAALIDHVFQFSRDNNIPNVRWLTQDFNTAARKLYDTYGEKSDFILYSFPV